MDIACQGMLCHEQDWVRLVAGLLIISLTHDPLQREVDTVPLVF